MRVAGPGADYAQYARTCIDDMTRAAWWPRDFTWSVRVVTMFPAFVDRKRRLKA